MAGWSGLFGWSSWPSQHYIQQTARQRSTCVWFVQVNEIILHVAQPSWVAAHQLRMWSLYHTSWKDNFWSKGQNKIKDGQICVVMKHKTNANSYKLPFICIPLYMPPCSATHLLTLHECTKFHVFHPVLRQYNIVSTQKILGLLSSRLLHWSW